MRLTEERFLKYLSDNCLKLTQERKAIFEYVSSVKGHFHPDDLYGRFKNDKKKISLASVYRTIPILVKSGIIREATQGKEGTKYEFASGQDHHDHMECVKCGKIVEFRNDEIEKLQDSVGKKYDFVLTGHRLELKGLCKECSKKR